MFRGGGVALHHPTGAGGPGAGHLVQVGWGQMESLHGQCWRPEWRGWRSVSAGAHLNTQLQ